MPSDKNGIRSMADLLRSGATLTDLSCPACSSPLFRLNSGDLWCAQCQKKVIVVKEDQQFEEVGTLTGLGAVEVTLMEKLQEINERITNTNNIDELERLNTILSSLLQNLEKVRRLGRPRI